MQFSGERVTGRVNRGFRSGWIQVESLRKLKIRFITAQQHLKLWLRGVTQSVPQTLILLYLYHWKKSSSSFSSATACAATVLRLRKGSLI